MSIVLNCFGLSAKVAKYLTTHLNSQYNLIFHELRSHLPKNDMVSVHDYIRYHAILLTKIYKTPIIIGVNSIELVKIEDIQVLL